MVNEESDPHAMLGLGYASFRLARAFLTRGNHPDAAIRQRADQKIARWEQVLNNIISGQLSYGSRQPVADTPVWVTLEVVTGGFATGSYLAGGELTSFEKKFAQDLPFLPKEGEERLAINSYLLTDEGLAHLYSLLETGKYAVNVPEEAALLTVAWLISHGEPELARGLVAVLAPWFSKLRFYPVPAEQRLQQGSVVHVQNVEDGVRSLEAVQPNYRILAQKEALEVWGPFKDRMVAHFLLTRQNGVLCKNITPEWRSQGKALLFDFTVLRENHKLCGKPADKNDHFFQLRKFLEIGVQSPKALQDSELSRIGSIIERHVKKHGTPGSDECKAHRQYLCQAINAPSHHSISRAMIYRLRALPQQDGIEDSEIVSRPLSTEEAALAGAPPQAAIPDVIQRKARRCLKDTIPALIESKIITSAEVLADVLPQISSGVKAIGIQDARLRTLYAATYRAFRQRRSLLLLNLEKQVQLDELPWVAAMSRFRSNELPAKTLAAQTLEDISFLAMRSFPQRIIPNKLIQELQALAQSGEVNIPLVEELAVDIFMGRFSPKFTYAVQKAAELLQNSLYATYYGIDYAGVAQYLAKGVAHKQSDTPGWIFWRKKESPKKHEDLLRQVCEQRANVVWGNWNPVINGKIIEQQQILTTQNLAVLTLGLNLSKRLQPYMQSMAQECFAWICRFQQAKFLDYHSMLIMLKQTAYAWRQMIFFLSLVSPGELSSFRDWLLGYYSKQPIEFQERFAPAVEGLRLALDGISPPLVPDLPTGPRVFLAWDNKHWLLPPK